jgi:glycolate oxidase iron-sulfur subunit
MPGAPAGAFRGTEGPDLDDLRTCVHCGICLPQCPTYLTLGQEMDSPRGRIYLMRAAAEGRIALTDTFARHLDLCLGCRACETACPSGVPFGRLLEGARAGVEPSRRRGALDRFLAGAFPDPGRLGRLLALARVYRRSGAQRLVRATGVLRRFPRLAALDALVDDVPAPHPVPVFTPAVGPRRGRAGLLTGCVQRHLYPGLNRDAVRLLSLAGYDVVAPADQGCCGALDVHAGRSGLFRRRARALAAAFGADLDVVVTTAAGCGTTMKEYGHWVDDGAARALAARTRDVSEVLAGAELPLGRLDLIATYHDACHLAHGQRIRREPRALLARIPGLRLVELSESDLCCGSAGVYNLEQPEVADRLLERKVQRIAESGARVVAAANPGCLMQIAKGCRARGLDVEVVHPVELLARAAERAVATGAPSAAAGGTS